MFRRRARRTYSIKNLNAKTDIKDRKEARKKVGVGGGRDRWRGVVDERVGVLGLAVPGLEFRVPDSG